MMRDKEATKWIVGLPGGPSGPFYSVIKPNGNIVAMQIPDKETAELIANIPLMLKKIRNYEQ